MFEILLSLGSVLVGGAIGLTGTYIQTRNQKNIRRREEILPVASRVLRGSHKAWNMVRAYALAVDRAKRLGPDAKSREGLKHIDYLRRHVDAYQDLLLSLEELSLLMPDLENEGEKLRKTVRMGALRPGREHKEEYGAFRKAREEFQQRLRKFLGT